MSLNRRSFSALALGLVAAPGIVRAQAGERPVLVELFTSQGCSSCPPADALMLRLADDPAFIPVTFATQIWDYLGWRDTLAKSEFTKRHKAYAAAVANRKVYTPQAIVNGRAHCVGSDLAAIGRLKSASAGAGRPSFTIAPEADRWLVTVDDQIGAGRLILVPVFSRQSVEIGRGENTGRTITYANVARGLIDLGDLAAAKGLAITRDAIARSNADAFVLIAQAGTPDAPGAVLGSAFVSAAVVKV